MGSSSLLNTKFNSFETTIVINKLKENNFVAGSRKSALNILPLFRSLLFPLNAVECTDD